MSDPHLTEQQATLTLVQVTVTHHAAHSLDAAAEITGVPSDMLRKYCELGLLGEARSQPDTDLTFNEADLYEVRRIEHYRRKLGVDLHALPVIANLVQEVERLRAELRFFRDLV